MLQKEHESQIGDIAKATVLSLLYKLKDSNEEALKAIVSSEDQEA